MPTSHSNQLNEIVQIAELLQPMSVLDIGIGNGKYGFLLREYLGNNRKLSKDDFIIDGIEGYKEYINPIHKEIYNDLYILNLSGEIALPEKRYGLCLLIDVIEHFERNRGMELIKFFFSISEFILVATPWDIGSPDIKHNNPLENHIYQWTKNDFSHFQNHCFIYNADSMIVLLGKEKDQIKFVRKKMRHRFYKKNYDYIRRFLRIKR